MNQSIIVIVSSVTLVLALFMGFYGIYQLKKLAKLKSALLLEGQPENLEAILKAIIKKLKALENDQALSKDNLTIMAEKLSLTTQKIGMKRFNSFAEDGGNLSFSVALLDEHDNGIVLTSLHGRQHNRIYAKPIQQGRSQLQLNDEEKGAITAAQLEYQDKNS